MLFWLRDTFPLLESRLTLASLGLALASLLTWILLPRLAPLLPCDRGKKHAHNGGKSQGKPTGAGVIFIPLYLATCFMVVPLGGAVTGVLGLAGATLPKELMAATGANPTGYWESLALQQRLDNA